MLNGDIIIARLGLSTLGQTSKSPLREGNPAGPAAPNAPQPPAHTSRHGAPPYRTPMRAIRIERSQTGSTTRREAVRDIRKTWVTPTAKST
jgi:hypothetical protein